MSDERTITMPTPTTWLFGAMVTAAGPSIRGIRFHLTLFLLVFMEKDKAEASPSSDSKPDDLHAICQSDYFRAKCPNDDVIMVTHAFYGRMHISRCVKENFGYLGCKNDVLDIMDGYCSGRRECSVRILDENFMNAKPCHDDLKSYLEVMYICVQVVSPGRQECQHHHPITLTNLTGYLASVVSAETGCGTADAPWSISGQPGQRINITLFDFSLDSVRMADAIVGVGGMSDAGGGLGGGGGSSRICVVYATIREASGRRSVTICGGEARRKVVHVSLDHCIEIRMISSQPEAVSFLLRYEVIGCPDITAPPGGWVKNNEEIAVFGCNAGPETWQMVCKGVEWMGEKGNCSIVSAQVEITTDMNTDDVLELPWGLSLIIIVALALSIWFIILTIGILCFKSKRTSDGALARSSGALNTGVGHLVSSTCTKHAVICRLHNAQATSNLERIKDLERPTYGSLSPPFAMPRTGRASKPRDYGALRPPSGALVHRWPTAKGPIEDPPTAAPHRLSYQCQSPYCLHSSRLHPPSEAPLAAETGESIYSPLCLHHFLLHSQSLQTDSRSPAPTGKIPGPPDVIVSPETETLYCSATTEQGAIWDRIAANEVGASVMRHDVTDAEKTATSSENWLAPQTDDSAKVTLLNQRDNVIL